MSACLGAGLIVYPGGTRINGVETSIFLIAPPWSQPLKTWGKLLDRLETGLKAFSADMDSRVPASLKAI